MEVLQLELYKDGRWEKNSEIYFQECIDLCFSTRSSRVTNTSLL
jgi:hypothetical protein